MDCKLMRLKCIILKKMLVNFRLVMSTTELASVVQTKIRSHLVKLACGACWPSIVRTTFFRLDSVFKMYKDIIIT